MVRALIADGGTGGHIFPALAVADELRNRDSTGSVLFTGTAAGLESGIIPRHGYELRMISVRGLIGKSVMRQMITLMQLPVAFLQSRRILQEFQPDLVIGFGAYASGPVLVAAYFRKTPILLVEPNAIPGFTNRKMIRFAARVAVPFEDTAGIYGGKAVVTGNPIRKLQSRSVENPKFTVGIMGGSQGARAINNAVLAALPALAEMKDRLHLLHQTGKADYDVVKAEYNQAAPWFEVTPFVENMEEFYNRCDLMVCRSGAITLAEITALGKPSILVPLPTAAHNHQEWNARRLEEAGAARIILQKDLSPDVLLKEIQAFLNSAERLQAVSEASAKLGKPEATKSVVDLALSLISRG